MSRVPSFISLVCLNLPRSRQAAYLSALPLSRVVSQREGKKPRRRGWLRLKGRGHCLKQSGCRLPFIYRLLRAHRVSLMEHESQERQTHTTPRSDNSDIQTVQKEAPLDKHMALFCLVEHLVTTHLTSLLQRQRQLQYACELRATLSARDSQI